MRQRKESRNKEIMDAYAEGLTYNRVAERFGLSAGRVRTIILREMRAKAEQEQLIQALLDV